MGAFFNLIISKISAVLSWIGQLFVAVFVAVWDFFTDLVCWIVEQFLGLAVSALAALDVSSISSNLSVFGSIPANVLEVLAAAGVGTALSIIASAIAIRFALQLIPFTRLGS